MATIVCQGLQSCLEPQVIESLVIGPQVIEPLVIRQTLSPTPQPKVQETKNVEKKNNGWSFLKVLDNPQMDSKNFDHQNDVVYVHPMTKRNASALSTKSLEMCTESLGSETGSDVSESGDEFCIISVEERERLRNIQRSKYNRNFDRKVRRSEFPPPLTSISGSDGTVKVRHHREGGRLVIKAVSVSNCGTNFQTERINGRLKLSLLRDCFENNESGRVEIENYGKGGEVESESEYDDVGEDEEKEDDDDDLAVAEDEVEDGGCGGDWWWDMDGNRWRIAGKGELKMVTYTRCKEGGNGNKVLTNWGSSWVAIS